MRIVIPLIFCFLLAGFLHDLAIKYIVSGYKHQLTIRPNPKPALVLLTAYLFHEKEFADSTLGLSRDELLKKFGKPFDSHVIQSDPQVFGFEPETFLKGDEEMIYKSPDLHFCIRNNHCIGYQTGEETRNLIGSLLDRGIINSDWI